MGELKQKERELRTSVYAPSTNLARARAAEAVRDFNNRFYAYHPLVKAGIPMFITAVDEEGETVSASVNARMFFAERSEQKQTTLRALKSNLNAVYAEFHLGPPPLGMTSARTQKQSLRSQSSRS